MKNNSKSLLEVSHTKLGMYRGCAMKYKFRYEDGLEPILFQPRMVIGTVIHSAVDMMYRGELEGNVVAYIIDTFDESIGNAELADQELLLIAKYTALGMFIHYPWKNLSSFTAIESELPFSIRVGKTRSVRFVGRIDRMLQANGRWWVNELKTTGLSQRQFQSRCHTSFQGTAYTYSGHRLGFKPAGIMFDCIKRPSLRKLRHETAEDFGKRILNDYGDYKKRDHYYQRYWSYRNDVELELFEHDFVKTIEELRWRKRGCRWYRNTDECWNFNTECPFKKICFTEKPDALTVELFYKKKGEKNGGGEKATQEVGSGEGQRDDAGRNKGTDEVKRNANQ